LLLKLKKKQQQQLSSIENFHLIGHFGVLAVDHEDTEFILEITGLIGVVLS